MVVGKDLEKALKEVDELIKLVKFCDLSGATDWICSGEKWVLDPKLNKQLLERHHLLRGLGLCSKVLAAGWGFSNADRRVDLERNLFHLEGLLRQRARIFHILAEEMQMKEGTPVSPEQLEMLGSIKKSGCPTVFEGRMR